MNFFISEAAKNILAEHALIIGNTSLAEKSEEDATPNDLNWDENKLDEFLGRIFLAERNGKFSIQYLKILNYMESLDFLIQSGQSLARFGDGELRVMMGGSHQFHNPNKKLQLKLQDTFKNPDNRCAIGIVSTLFKLKMPNDYWKETSPLIKKVIKNELDFGRVYLNTNMTLFFSNKRTKWGDAYFSKFRSLWEKKKILLVTNFELFDKLNNNIFDNAKEIIKIDTPKKNAFDEYDRIMNEIQKYDTTYTVILIIGMTATVMANDLSKIGYRALDLGHLARCYDLYQDGKERPANFFSY